MLIQPEIEDVMKEAKKENKGDTNNIKIIKKPRKYINPKRTTKNIKFVEYSKSNSYLDKFKRNKSNLNGTERRKINVHKEGIKQKSNYMSQGIITPKGSNKSKGFNRTWKYGSDNRILNPNTNSYMTRFLHKVSQNVKLNREKMIEKVDGIESKMKDKLIGNDLTLQKRYLF